MAAGIVNLEGDATPGSSGSAVLNPNGKLIGILFQLKTLDGNSDALCILDIVMTSFKSILYDYYPLMGPVAISGKEIQKALSARGVVL